MIAAREAVRAAVTRALLLDPTAGQDAAIDAASQSLALPVEAVRDAMDDEVTS